eukprot:comp16115_c0_seq1/m.25388 comp16115_c0_seq1/g.25388  ORF comp16115_c0_seq1/g.25388 comp16115_c0_seq1/m.25388 type:complete len:349 (-) comp16115_c0_seq1:125-1171(-)
MQHNANVAAEHGAVGIDGQRAPEMIQRQIVLLLAEVDDAETIPCIVVPLVGAQGNTEARQGLVVVLNRKELVARKGVRIRAERIDLARAPEKLECGLVVLLQRKAVTDNTPRGWAAVVLFEHLLRQICHLHLLAQMPQHRRVDLDAVHEMRINLEGILEHFHRLAVPHHLKVAARNRNKNPARLALRVRKRIEQLQRILALIHRKLLESCANIGQQCKHRTLANHPRRVLRRRNLRQRDPLAHSIVGPKAHPIAASLLEQLQRTHAILQTRAAATTTTTFLVVIVVVFLDVRHVVFIVGLGGLALRGVVGVVVVVVGQLGRLLFGHKPGLFQGAFSQRRQLLAELERF